ncbi:MAG: three-Cys-motif partner protein TcmP [Methanothrix sp.]|nr:three-Cys-motif partner protein TcmP [Methanothrix sp.]
MISQIKKHNEDKIAYIDLFAGRGRYDDGTKSTPLLILEKAIQNPDTRDMLVTVFNDIDLDNIRSLKTEVSGISNISALKYKPEIINEEVGEDLVKELETMHFVPTLFFIDPCGYKGLSLDLFKAILKDWGCDCLFFFNYNRINPALENDIVREHMDALFGIERANRLREKLRTISSPIDRENTIMNEIKQALNGMGGKYVQPFCFKNDRGTRTSHYLIFMTKHPLGYKIMKDIMAKVSICSEQGVPTFEYNPAKSYQMRLSGLSTLEGLEADLLTEFAGRTLLFEQMDEKGNGYIW